MSHLSNVKIYLHKITGCSSQQTRLALKLFAQAVQVGERDNGN